MYIDFRKVLALKAFTHTATYDDAIHSDHFLCILRLLRFLE